MGQKVNPISFRLQLNKNWRSKWFAPKKDYTIFLTQDLAVRRMIDKKIGSRGAINTVDIERSPNMVSVTIHTAKAGVVIGRGGAGAQELKAAIEKIYGIQVRVNIEEVKKLDSEDEGTEMMIHIDYTNATNSAPSSINTTALMESNTK